MYVQSHKKLCVCHTSFFFRKSLLSLVGLRSGWCLPITKGLICDLKAPMRQNCISALVGRPYSCYIGNKSIYFCEMATTKAFRTQDGVPRSQSGSPTTKMIQIGQNTLKRTQKTKLSDLVRVQQLLH